MNEPDISNEEIVEAAVLKDPKQINYASNNLKQNKAFIMRILEKKEEIIFHLYDLYKDDAEVIRVVAEKYHSYRLKKAPQKLKGNREFMKYHMEIKPYSTYELLSDELKNDIEFVKMAVASSGEIVRELDDSWTDNEEFMLYSIQHSTFCYEFASKRLREDEDFRVKASILQPAVLDYFIKELQISHLLKILSKNGLCFEYLTNDQKMNKDLQMEAVKNNGVALKFMNNTSKDVVLEALWSGWEAFDYAPEQWKNNKDFILEVINRNPKIYQFISKKLKSDKTIAILSIKKSPEMIRFVPTILMKDQEINWISKKYHNIIRNTRFEDIHFSIK